MNSNRSTPKRVIVVLGMHRSGTSVITRGLAALGVTLGDRLMPPQPVNPKGFWEDLDVNELNVQMLNAVGSDWHCLAPIEPEDVDALRDKGFLERAASLLRGKVCDSRVFGFKDPRVTKLLPVWNEVISQCGFEAAYVLTLRHPLSVVDSLTHTMGFDADKTYALWLAHVITSVAGTVGKNRVLVDYDLMMQAPERQLNRIANHLKLEIDPEASHNYRFDFLDSALRHSVYSLQDLSLDSACPALVREVYTSLLDVAVDQRTVDDVEVNAACVRWARDLERSIWLLKQADRLYAKNLHLHRLAACSEKLIIEHDDHIARLTKIVAERDAQIAILSETNLERGRLIQAFIDSMSWKLTKPLRALRRLIT
ncbi:MAG: sulfotransferase [Burkholderiales bacterium]